MRILKASIADITDLETLINSAYRGETSKQGWTTEADLLGGIRIDAERLEEMMNNHMVTFLKFCNENNAIEGCVYLEKKGNKMYVGLLTVSPVLQGKGIGKILLSAAEVHALENNCDAMQMTVISVRHELIEWYERSGYKKTGEIQPFPSDEKFGIARQPLEFIVLEKVSYHLAPQGRYKSTRGVAPGS